MNVKAKRITTIAMLCALAYVVMAVGRVPVVLFLKYDPNISQYSGICEKKKAPSGRGLFPNCFRNVPRGLPTARGCRILGAQLNRDVFRAG